VNLLLLIVWEWRPRTLLHAQLTEEGYEVLAVGSWEEAELLLIKGAVRATAGVFDLAGEPNPAASLRTLVRMMSPDRVLVLTSAAALPVGEIRDIGFTHVMARPFSVRDVLDEVARIGGPRRSGQDGSRAGEAPK
jgi:hypothetical protein